MPLHSHTVREIQFLKACDANWRPFIVHPHINAAATNESCQDRQSIRANSSLLATADAKGLLRRSIHFCLFLTTA